MAGLREIFEKAKQTGQVEYTFFGGATSVPFRQYSYPFGNDQAYGAGSSKQPYIRVGIDPDNQFSSTDPSGLLNKRLAITRDTERLSKWFTDGTQGLIFTAKQQSLHLSNPNTSYKSDLSLTGPQVYNPLSINTNTISAPLGVHTLKHVSLNLDPNENTGYLTQNLEGSEFKSRLLTYQEKLVKGNQSGNILLNSYLGGPDSTYGVGTTKTFTYGEKYGLNTGETDKGSIYPEAQPSYMGFEPWSYNDINNYSYSQTKNPLVDTNAKNLSKYPLDFRGKDPEFDYPALNVHARVGVTSNRNNIGSPNTVDSINILKITKSATFFANSNSARNKYETSDIYTKGYDKSKVKDNVGGYYGRDIIKFRIEALNNNTPIVSNSVNTDVLAFRAYLNSMTDNFNATWRDFNYMGRGESFYAYEKFNREIQLGFTFFAHSAPEMSSLYTKLNYLMSIMAPDYNSQNQMRGNYVYVTVGDYIYRQPGVLSSLSISDFFGEGGAAPWEIAINEPEAQAGVSESEDNLHYEVPKLLRISLTFKPIHNFLPKRMYNEDEMPNHTATFVTPNHMLINGYNRYLPSDIKKEKPKTYTTDETKPSTPKVEPVPQPKPEKPPVQRKKEGVPGGFRERPIPEVFRPNLGRNTTDNTRVEDARYLPGPRPISSQNWVEFGGGQGYDGGGSGGNGRFRNGGDF